MLCPRIAEAFVSPSPAALLVQRPLYVEPSCAAALPSMDPPPVQNQMQAPLNSFLSAAHVSPPSWAAGPLFWPRRWPWWGWGWPWPWASSPWCPCSSSTSGGPSSSSTAPTPSSSSSPRRSWCLSASHRSGTPSKTAPEVSVRSRVFPPDLAPTLSSSYMESTGWFLSRP